MLINWLQAVLYTFLGRAFPGMCICLFEIFFHFPSPPPPRLPGFAFFCASTRDAIQGCWSWDSSWLVGWSRHKPKGPGSITCCLVWFNFQSLLQPPSHGKLLWQQNPAVPALEIKKSEISPVGLVAPQNVFGEAQEEEPKAAIPCWNCLFPSSWLDKVWREPPGQASLHSQDNPWASWIIPSPKIPSAAAWGTRPPNSLLCFSDTKAQLVSHRNFISIEMTAEHGKSSPSLPWLLQRKAGETQEQRQPQRNRLQKGYSTGIFILPRHLEAAACTQTQHFTSAHSLIWFPGLPY